MMRKIVLSGLVACCAALSCITNKNTLTHDFPAAMSPVVKAEYVKQWEKGKTLYEINCAKCHNLHIKGRTVIPDFAPEQLKGYELRVTNQQHETGIPETNVTTEELGLIMTFLTYKKKNDAVRR